MAIRILVVDDSVVIRKLLTQTLGEVPGMEVVATAALGKIALAKIQQCSPDIVILDVEMPEMDGIETLKHIRKLAPRLPVIMFSTKTERGAAATIEALTSGASDYVAKPSNVGNVLVAMARVREEMVPKIHALTVGRSPAAPPGKPASAAGSTQLPPTAAMIPIAGPAQPAAPIAGATSAMPALSRTATAMPPPGATAAMPALRPTSAIPALSPHAPGMPPPPANAPAAPPPRATSAMAPLAPTGDGRATSAMSALTPLGSHHDGRASSAMSALTPLGPLGPHGEGRATSAMSALSAHAEGRATSAMSALSAHADGRGTAAIPALTPLGPHDGRGTAAIPALGGHPALGGEPRATAAMPALGDRATAAMPAFSSFTVQSIAPGKQPHPPTPPPPPIMNVGPIRLAPAGGPRPPVEIVAIGASTGGPNALAVLLPELPAEFPVPIVIVQHMLATFTRHFAERLAAQCRIKIVEATAGEALLPGHAYIARGDYHLLAERRAGRPSLAMNQDLAENFCRPAVDVLFRSVAHVYGASALAIVLTGMGHDGLLGCGAIREAGGDVIVQDEQSSVVWGMPGFVARAGLASQVVPLDQLGLEVRRRVPGTGPAVGATL